SAGAAEPILVHDADRDLSALQGRKPGARREHVAFVWRTADRESDGPYFAGVRTRRGPHKERAEPLRRVAGEVDGGFADREWTGIFQPAGVARVFHVCELDGRV